MTHKNYSLVYLIVLLFFISKCNPVPTAPATIGPTTFTIPEPQRFDCFIRHQAPGIPTTKISVMINIVTYYFDGQRQVRLDDATLTVDPNITSFPVTLTANMPNDNRPAVVEVNIQGTMCSECANTYGDPQEQPYMNCINALVGTNPTTYRAARPRWLTGARLQNYVTNTVLDKATPITNVPNTCGCVVN